MLFKKKPVPEVVDVRPDVRLRMWDEIEAGWWQRSTGGVCANLKSDAEVGWEVYVERGGQRVSRPTFIADFSNAVKTAVWVYEKYEREGLVSANRLRETAEA